MPFRSRHEANEKRHEKQSSSKKRLEMLLRRRWLRWLKTSAKRQTNALFWLRHGLSSDISSIDSPFLDAVFAKSSLIDDALQELGLSDEYSLIGVVDWGDIMLVESGFAAASLAAMLPSCWWWEFDKWGYHVGLRGGQQESRIDWWRWLLFSKRSLS